MLLPRGAVMALQALDHLARNPGRERFLVTAVARELSVSPTYLAKIFQTLARRGVVRSARGRGGGYRLARRPAETLIGDVLRALAPPGRRARRPGRDPRLAALLADAEAEWVRALNRRTLADLALPVRPTAAVPALPARLSDARL